MTLIKSQVNLAPLGEGDGVIITPSSAETTFQHLHNIGLDELVADAGHILLRGFRPTTDDFNDLVQQYSSRVTLDPARVFHGSAAQKVDSGRGPIGLHMENGATPFAPDLLWFYCVKAAKSGSETTVCDGYRVWDQLSERSKELFASTPIKYSRNVPAALWRRFASFLANDGRAAEDMTISDLYNLTNPNVSAEFTELKDGSLRYEFTMFAAHPTKWSTRIAWSNSILGPSFNYEAPDIRFADGRTIPDDAQEEYARVTESLIEEVAWQDGDIVLIDNSRVMHGRRVITDPHRTILNSQSFARN
jgi:hypothetical protein